MFQITFKRVLIFSSFLIGFAVIMNILSESINVNNDAYISDISEQIKYDDVKEYMAKVDFKDNRTTDLFKKGAVNKYTLKFFKHLQMKYKDMEYSDHIEAVRKYLYSIMESGEADKFIDLYIKYIKYENLVSSAINSAGEIKSTEDYLKLLKNMKSLQQEIFGKEIAEIIFGVMMKSQEYPIRRGGIINDNSLYASEKEKLLKKLNSDMWGEDGNKVEQSRKPYVAYTEALSIYSKDMSEMSDSQKNDKISEIRKSVFPPDVVKRLEDVDNEIEKEQQRDNQYKKEYDDIVNNNEISSEDKESKIRVLQDRIYGNESDSIRRIDSISKGKEEMMKEYNIN